jgi:uncharacterized coiled-coil DUF342 family protein
MAGSLSSVKTQVEGLRKEVMELKEAQGDLESKLQKALKERDALSARVEELDAMVVEVRGHMAKKERELVGVQGEKSKAMSNEATQRGRATEMSRTVAELERKLADARNEHDQALASLAGIKGQITEKNTQLANKDEQLDTARADIRLLQVFFLPLLNPFRLSLLLFPFLPLSSPPPRSSRPVLHDDPTLQTCSVAFFRRRWRSCALSSKFARISWTRKNPRGKLWRTRTHR